MLLAKPSISGLALPLFIVCSSLISAVASRIPLGSKLTVEEGNRWVSPNGGFAFGFFNSSDQPNRYGVGIRFNSAPLPVGERPVVWVAGADLWVGRRSYLCLTEAGELVLFDSSRGMVAWASNTSDSSVSSADLLDDGNLVLLNRAQDVVWQSFGTPSDTLLPGQKLTPPQTLRAAGRSSVSSYYTLSMDAGGQLKLSWETNVTYWKTQAPAAQPPLAAFFTGDGALKLLDGMPSAVWSTYGDDHGDPAVGFRFLRLDVDGNLRMYSWAEESRSWRSVWQAVQNQCDVFATCGLHGVCFFNSSGAAGCKCPFGSSSGSISTSCLAPYNQNCRSGATVAVLEHTFLYGVYPPEDASLQLSSEQCIRSCLQDPSCTSVTATNDGNARCLMKRTQFVTGYEDPSLASVSFVKVCLNPVAAALPGSSSASSPPSPSSPAKTSSRPLCTPCLIGAAGGTFVALCSIQLITLGLWSMIRRKKKAAETRRASSQTLCANPVGVVSLSPSEIKNLTGDFKHRLGSNTYKGVLPNRKMVVIRDMKESKQSAGAADDRHFRRWVSVLGGVHHKNLVRLEAFSCDSEQRFLVYEFAKNGSVERWLGEPRLSRRLTWTKRMEICAGVARAVAYLHSECREHICHGNLNWGDVVLDAALEAKVTGYGLWKLGGAPEAEGGAAAADDVARFGEMVLTLVSGVRGVWADVYREWAEGHVERMVDSSMGGGRVVVEEAERALRVAFWCVQEDERLRPSMVEVAKALEGALPVDPPPFPSPSLKKQLPSSAPP
uniref:Receptor-like serine/threonine-protein kinase n=1 Tax=Anthurium amnicola TaxID=1678845 RepID=A0A1D1XT90_9ARAE